MYSLDLHSFPTRRSSDLRGFSPTAFASKIGRARRVNSPSFTIGRTNSWRSGYTIRILRFEFAFCIPENPKSWRSEEHTSELQSRQYLVCRLLLEKEKQIR